MAFEITIPRLGWSMEEGTFVAWLRKEGDRIESGDVLFELEGEKALQEIEALDDGVLKIPANGPQPGAVLKVGAVIGYLLAEGEVLPQAACAPLAAGGPVAREEVSAATEDIYAGASPSVRRLARELAVDLKTVRGTGTHARITDDDVRLAARRNSEPVVARTMPHVTKNTATPRARRAARLAGIDPATLHGTGRDGRIRERDVALAAKALSTSVHNSGGQRMVMSGRRKVIADRLTASHQQTVPVTLTSQADATNLVSLREQFRTSGESLLPAFHDIIAKLVAGCLQQHRQLASRRDHDTIVLPSDTEMHIGLAVDTPEGLIVPVLRNVLKEPLLRLAVESSRMIAKAREGRLSAAEMQDAVFSITNLGSFGIDAFTPVINLPETAILGLGAIRKQPVAGSDNRIEVRSIMTLSLTFDHRTVDGAPAARFLQAVVAAIENPAARLLTSG
ncbi:MAG: 2-oxo acid dehydrogenase subunit E2 [Planctomycetaceae bacterium]|nr:2-oxo acid dehydrogenase subunit E2 [Planctomycetaceae bacterium]